MQILPTQSHQHIVASTQILGNFNRSNNFDQNHGDIDKINIISNYNDTNTTNSIINFIDRISKIETYQKTINTQISALDKIDTTLKNNNASIGVANLFLEDITTNIQALYEDMNDQENQFSKSYSYFDGIKGSLPMNFENIKKTAKESQEYFKEINNSLQNKHSDLVSSIRDMLNKQKQQLQTNIVFSEKTSVKDDLNNLYGDFTQVQQSSINSKKLLY